MAQMGKTKNLVLGLAALMIAVSLSACDDGRSAAEGAAKQLASSLAALDVGSLAVDGKDAAAANEQLKAVFAALDPAKPSVESGAVKLDGDTASVPLNFTWKIGTAEWKYASQAALKKSGDKWAVQWTTALLEPDLKDGEVLDKTITAPSRAEILGAGDAKLISYRPVVYVGIDKTTIGSADPAASAAKLAQLVGVDEAAYVKQVQSSGPQAFVSAITLRQDGRTITDQQIAAIPGARGIPDSLPLAPTRTFARAVLGTVAEASAEQIQKAGGALKAGDVVGTGGLEEQYDSLLRGQDGVSIKVRPQGMTDDQLKAAKPDPRRVLFSVDTKPGDPLKTTLDPRLQQLAEDTLAGVGPASAIVALRPSTGAVLAAASGPGSNGYNTAMLGQYAPGSTFKIVDSLALIRNGMTPDSKVECTPTITVDGRTFKNAEGYPESSLGSVALRDAFAHSCNTAFISSRDKVSQAQLESAATSLGLAVQAPKLGADAFLGSVPGNADGTEHAASMIGQGKVLLSPLAAAIMAASVAHGAPVSPQLVLNPGALSPSAGAAPTASGPPSSSSAAPVSPAAPGSDKPVTPAEAAAERHDEGRGDLRPRRFPRVGAGGARGREDRDGRIRKRQPAQDARLDRGSARRPGGGSVRGRRRPRRDN